MTELNAWGGKVRKTPESISNPEHVYDPARHISRILGGPPFLQESGAMYVHRVGLMKGIAFCLPYSGASRDINYVRITINELSNAWDMLFGRVDLEKHFAHEYVDVVESIKNVPSNQVVKEYHRATTDE